jgi:hypothetical protein
MNLVQYLKPILIANFAFNLVVPGIITMSDEEAQEHFDNFFEDVFVECEDKVRISFFFPFTI